MHVCTDLLCVVCIGLLSDEFPTGKAYILESWRLKSLFTGKQFLSSKFLETRIMEIKGKILNEDAMAMEEWNY